MNKHKAIKSPQNNTSNIRDVQTQIVDAILLLGGLIGLVGALTVLETVARLGWKPLSVGFVIILGIVALTGLLRNRLPYPVKTGVLITSLYAVGLINLIGWGLFGSSSIWFIVTVVVAMILHDTRIGLIVYGAVIVSMTLVAILFQTNVFAYDIDLEAYATADVTWFGRVLMVVFVCAMLVASIGRLIEVLRSQLIRVQQVADTLEDRTQDLMIEVQKREAAELALASAVGELKELDVLKDKFIDSVSHELRTPLANIQLYHQLLGLKPEKAKDYLQTLGKETERLSYIVEQMIHASNDNYDMTLTTMVDVDVLELTRAFFDAQQTVIEDKNITVTIQDPDTRYITLAAVEHMERAIANVVDNALKYTPENGIITVRAERFIRDEQACISLMITNNSVGCIDKKEKDAIFERFYRGASALQLGVPGAGLGLSIARQVIQQYGGTISVDCQVIDDDNILVTFIIELTSVTPLEEIIADMNPTPVSSA